MSGYRRSEGIDQGLSHEEINGGPPEYDDLFLLLWSMIFPQGKAISGLTNDDLIWLILMRNSYRNLMDIGRVSDDMDLKRGVCWIITRRRTLE